jgi:ribosome assembly protein YihI (activator of Der GTPase)
MDYTDEQRVKELLLGLQGQDSDPARSMRARLEAMLAQLGGGEALGPQDQSWLDEEWRRAVNREGIVRLRRGQLFNETL